MGGHYELFVVVAELDGDGELVLEFNFNRLKVEVGFVVQLENVDLLVFASRDEQDGVLREFQVGHGVVELVVLGQLLPIKPEQNLTGLRPKGEQNPAVFEGYVVHCRQLVVQRPKIQQLLCFDRQPLYKLRRAPEK